jgi:hypothetical protein
MVTTLRPHNLRVRVTFPHTGAAGPRTLRSMRRFIAFALLGLVSTPLVTGCGTFESGTWSIKIRNDTSRFVVVSGCKTSACQPPFRYAKQLRSRATVQVSDYGDGTSWWRVTNRRGRRIGCLTLGRSQRVDGYILAISSLTGCP